MQLFRSSSNAKIHPIVYDNVVIKDGHTVYTGNALNGKKHGQGVYVDYAAHVEYNGEWKDDNIHGKGTIVNYFRDYGFTGQFENNDMIYGTMTWPDGTVYVGYFENNEVHGVGTMTWPPKNPIYKGMVKYEGMFVNGKPEGFGIYTDAKGKIYEQN